jgi:hypothetical protein
MSPAASLSAAVVHQAAVRSDVDPAEAPKAAADLVLKVIIGRPIPIAMAPARGDRTAEQGSNAELMATRDVAVVRHPVPPPGAFVSDPYLPSVPGERQAQADTDRPISPGKRQT